MDGGRGRDPGRRPVTCRPFALLAALLFVMPAAAVEPGPVTTRHTLALPDGTLAYRAVVEILPVRDQAGGAAADVAVISYAAEGPAEGAEAGARPVTFVFNGGPGASSAYLHLGALGPRVLATAEDGGVPVPPARLRDNPDTWLAFTDLVFIDPVGTGYSRAAEPGSDAAKAFWSVSGDRDSLAEVIRLWLTRHGRWQSPKFIAGESYGGFRAVLVARRLLEDQGVALNGLVLISPVLDFSTISAGRTDVLPWALMLPSMAASARAQGRGEPGTPMEEVERWALTEYLAGIAAIAPSGPGPAPEVIDRVAALLGLEHDLVRRHHGRVPAWIFARRLLDGTGRALSLYDGSLAGPDPRPGRSGPDPQLEATRAPLSTAYNVYVRTELGFETELPFRLLDEGPARDWDWEGVRGGSGRTDGAMGDLAEVMALTPGLGLLVVHGRTDMVTPYMASRWLLDRIDLPEEIRANAGLEVLDGGHMMYLIPAQRKALGAAAARFYRERTPVP
jgi:carboxypeptidase C (cathepsin A)